MKLVLLTLGLFIITSTAYAVEIESIQLGWGEESYVREGYFVPLRISVNSSSDFSGWISFSNADLIYSKPLFVSKDIQASTAAVIPIILSESKTELTLWNDRQSLLQQNDNQGKLGRKEIQTHPVKTDEFLIAVEKPYLALWQKEFELRFPDAAHKTRFAACDPETLPEIPSAFEALDLLVLSNANLPVRIQIALNQWQAKGHGIVIYRMGGIGDLPELFASRKKDRKSNPSINPALYQESFAKISNSLKGVFLNYLIVYAVFVMIIMSVLVAVRSRIMASITIVALVLLSVSLLFIFFLPSSGASGLFLEKSSDLLTNQSKPDLSAGDYSYVRMINYAENSNILPFVLETNPQALIMPIYAGISEFKGTKVHFISENHKILVELKGNQPVKLFYFQIN